MPKKKMVDTPKEQVEQIRACVAAVPGDEKGFQRPMERLPCSVAVWKPSVRKGGEA
jgi:hypothetical protein